MRFTIVLFFIGLVAADKPTRPQPIPKCGRPCLEAAISKAGCAKEDLPCTCDPATSQLIVDYAKDCILERCGERGGLKLRKIALNNCKLLMKQMRNENGKRDVDSDADLDF